MKPYWQSSDGAITVYHDRMEDVLAAGVVPVREVALVHADPMYGTGRDANRDHVAEGVRSGKGLAGRRVYQQLEDSTPFDPSPLLALDRPLVLWGANHYSDKVPPSPSWFLWDKREDTGSDDNADGELAWSNVGGPLRIFRHVWKGMIRASEREPRKHPTQKPIALCSWVYSRAKLKPGALVFVPYLGSGPDLPAARAMGLRVIACEVERAYCDTAIARLGAVTAERAAEPAGPLFVVPR